MTVRDLGYRPYEGERLPPTHNTIVMFRHGLRRAWASWLVKLPVFLGWIPMVIAWILVGLGWAQRAGMEKLGAPPEEIHARFDPGGFLSTFLWFEMMLLVSFATMGAGASAIAQDRSYKAFQFYFAKPITPVQYLVARIGAVAFWCLMLTFVPALFVVLALVGAAPEPLRMQAVGTLLPTLLHSLLISVTAAAASVGMSALSSSRALTMIAWIVLFLLPWGVAAIVWRVAEWPWLRIVAFPSLLGAIGNGLFQVPAEGDIRWYHALPVLLALVGGAVYIAWRRITESEVIT